MPLTLDNLYDDFRNPDTVKAYAKLIADEAERMQQLILNRDNLQKAKG